QKSSHENTSEAVAATGFSVDQHLGLISFIIHNIGTSSTAITHLKMGDEISIMGPTGRGISVVENEKVFLCGSSYGHSFLISLIKEFKKKNCEIIYFADALESHAMKDILIQSGVDEIIWSQDDSDRLFSDEMLIAIKKCVRHIASGPRPFIE